MVENCCAFKILPSMERIYINLFQRSSFEELLSNPKGDKSGKPPNLSIKDGGLRLFTTKGQ
jgi:hypothetical protein